jgi:pyridoxal 5'-phosphate synthase pdxT subunit
LHPPMVLRIGVIGLQGDVQEHIDALNEAMEEMGIEGKAFWARRPKDLEGADGAVLPGGESTTISKLLVRFGLLDILLEMAKEHKPILGTCAGAVLLAKEGDAQVERTGTVLLKLMDMAVDRNAFGPQRESFESDIEIEGLGQYPGVFIRAPIIKKVWGDCKELSRTDKGIVLARQGNMLAASFHPELTSNRSFYRLFLSLFDPDGKG